jgi:exonuclease 3'-5' domain-containing protein 1
MSPETTTTRVEVISTTSDLKTFLALIPPSSELYLDLEYKGRHGTLTIITILVYPTKNVGVIDVQTLGPLAFTTRSPLKPPWTLRSVLQDPAIPKCFWDVRNDADALKALYGVGLAGVTDIQLLENATRSGSKMYLRGLNTCVRKDLDLTTLELSRWVDVKQQGSAGMGHVYVEIHMDGSATYKGQPAE